MHLHPGPGGPAAAGSRLSEMARSLAGTVARAAWPPTAALVLALFAASIPGYLTRRPLGGLGDHLSYVPSPSMLAVSRLNLLVSVLVLVASLALAWVVYVRRRRDPVALFVAYFMLVHAVVRSGTVEMLEPYWPRATEVNALLLDPALYMPLTAILLAVFPTGRAVPQWVRWPALATVPAGLLSGALMLAHHEEPAGLWLRPEGIALVVFWVAVFAALAWGQRRRYRTGTATQRRQIQWVLYGYALALALVTISTVPWTLAQSLPAGTAMPWWVPYGESVWMVAVAVVPATLAVAILRHRLFGIELLIDRTLVYGSLTSLVLVLYVVGVAAAGVLFHARDNLVVGLLATGVVAALFQPLRQRLQRAVNRLVYGERDDPYAVLAGLGRRLEEAMAPQEVLPMLAETVARALKLPYVAVRLDVGGASETAAAFGRPSGALLTLALVHQGEQVGSLVAAPRPGEASVTPAERQLLEAIARQASVAAHGVRVATELQRSRERLVATREEERRRLRRDLHDGLGPALAAMSLRLDAARDRLAPEQTETDAMLGKVADQLAEAVADIRRLIHGLRPPALDDLGLLGALRTQASQVEGPHLQVTLEAPERLPPLPAATEAAALRIVQEALTNVVRHACASHCRVTVSATSSLLIAVEDDGRGMVPDARPGVGLRSMRERAEELGGAILFARGPLGGVRVEARLPAVGSQGAR